MVILLSFATTMINNKISFASILLRKFGVGSSEDKDTASSLVQRKQTESPTPMMSIESGSVSTKNLRKGNLSAGETKKPLFVLHIGPPKTGTTTLQCELGLKYPDLLQENFYYLGTYYAPLCGLPMSHRIEGFSDATRPVLLHCYAPHTREGCDLDKQWQDFANILESHKEHNIIMSDEMFHHHFAQEDVERFAKLLKPHWDVRIIYTYRHFYSSLPSMYHQLNDPYATNPGMAYAVEKTIWPENGGYKIRSFRESNYFYIEHEMTRFFYWVIAFGDVSVFNMHNTNGVDYLPAFLCTMIPEATSLCSPSQPALVEPAESAAHNDNSSASKYLRYDMLAVAAHELGLLEHTILSREMVRDAVEEYCEAKKWTNIDDFPLDCLSNAEMDSFFEESLRQASMLSPYFTNPQEDSIQDEIRSGFQEFRNKKKFCSINAERALEEEHWRHFFLSMR